MNFANLYRPARFEDVVGQRQTVGILSGLARRRKTRNILLSGAFGSGKTSMARILASAWNCATPTALGSPCGECDFCSGKRGQAIFECTVTTMAGDAKDICPILQRWNRTPTEFPVQTIFFDEAHGLTESGVDALLKATEEPPGGVCFTFATTKPWLLPNTLKSRLFEVRVNPLNQSDSVALLRRIAQTANLTFDTEAFVLLAALKRGHPRDLLNGLEQVSISSKHITVDAVKRAFDLEQEDYLARYFLALAKGDVPDQHRLLEAWKEPLATKIAWIRAYLLSVYHRDLNGHDITVDPAVDSMRSSRREIVRLFAERLQVDSPNKLEPFWRRMLDFWFVEPSADDALLRLRLSLFETLVNGGAGDEQGGASLPASLRSADQLNVSDLEQELGNTEADRIVLEEDHREHHFGSQELRQIVNRSSAFAQHFGQYMNVRIELTPSFEAMQSDVTATKVIERFAENFYSFIAAGGKTSAVITVFDKVATGVVGKIVACVPDLSEGDGRASSLQAWCHEWIFAGTRGHHVELAIARRGTSLKFHWNAIGWLAARMYDVAEAKKDGSITLARHLSQALRIKPDEGYIGPLLRSPVMFSESLSDGAVDRARQLSMPFLSAIDDGAFDWLTNGWELVEHQERRREQLSRESAIRAIEETYDEEEQRVAALEALEKQWHGSAQTRPRKSSNWWWRQ